MLLNKFFQKVESLESFLNMLLLDYVMARHWNLQTVPFRIDLRVYLLQFFGCCLSFRFSTCLRVFELI